MIIKFETGCINKNYIAKGVRSEIWIKSNENLKYIIKNLCATNKM